MTHEAGISRPTIYSLECGETVNLAERSKEIIINFIKVALNGSAMLWTMRARLEKSIGKEITSKRIDLICQFNKGWKPTDVRA